MTISDAFRNESAYGLWPTTHRRCRIRDVDHGDGAGGVREGVGAIAGDCHERRAERLRHRAGEHRCGRHARLRSRRRNKSRERASARRASDARAARDPQRVEPSPCSLRVLPRRSFRSWPVGANGVKTGKLSPMRGYGLGQGIKYDLPSRARHQVRPASCRQVLQRALQHLRSCIPAQRS